VLEGSVVRRGDKLHVIAQLIRTSDGYHLWSHTYETTLAGLPPVEAGIARAARETLVPSATEPTSIATTRNPEAHDLYMRAVYAFSQRTAESTKQAINLAREATEKDSSFAQPYVVMATSESELTQLQVQAPRLSAEHEWDDIAKALTLDPGNSGAHALKALLAYTDHWDWPQAEREFRLSLAAGSHGSAENLYGWCLITRGRFDEARRRLQLAAELDPLSLGPQLNQAEELMVERNYPGAKG
jgi:tetratricopeptide (TPR) repeat protein